jgi:segregation and condensation protein B
VKLSLALRRSSSQVSSRQKISSVCNSMGHLVTLNGIVEALLFGAPTPLTIQQISQVLREAAEYAAERSSIEWTEAAIDESLHTLAQKYELDNHAFQLVERAGGWQLASRPDYAPWIRQLYPELRPNRLSGPGLETLAIVAYRQPITKSDIEAIRGVSVEGLLQKLLDAGLIKIAGRAEVPGRPLLYETTRHFLEHFGFKSLGELPNAAELRHLSDAPLKKPTQSEAQSEQLEFVDSDPSAENDGSGTDRNHDLQTQVGDPRSLSPPAGISEQS